MKKIIAMAAILAVVTACASLPPDLQPAYKAPEAGEECGPSCEGKKFIDFLLWEAPLFY